MNPDETGSTATMPTLDLEGTMALEERIVQALKTVYDPEIPVDIYELGLIYDIDVHAGAEAAGAEPAGAEPGGAEAGGAEASGAVAAGGPAPGSRVKVRMTLTSPACPVAGSLPGEVEQKVQGVEGVENAEVELVWDPPWNPGMMSEAARLELGMF